MTDRIALRRMKFKAIWPTAPRDFAVCTTWDEQYLPDDEPHNTEDNTDMHSLFMASRSPHPTESPIGDSSGYVRGFIHVSGYWIKPLPPVAPGTESTECLVMLAAHTELGGTIPSGVVNALSSSAPLKILSTLKEILKRK